MNVKTNFICGLATMAGTVLLSASVLKCHDNTQKNNHSNRIQNMEYVKRNNVNKYVETLEIVNKTNSPRITPEYIDNIWMTAVKAVNDSISMVKNNKKGDI